MTSTARGDRDSVLVLQARLAEMEPLDESINRELIAHHRADNRYSEALRYYRAL